MIDQYKAAYNPGIKVAGTYAIMINDTDPSQHIRVMMADTDNVGNPLPSPFYVIWDIEKGQDTSNVVPLLQFDQDTTLKYSLILYAQTSTGGAEPQFEPEDNYIDINVDKPKPKTVGIIFDANNKITDIFYRNQMCKLQGNSSSYKDAQGNNVNFTVKQNKIDVPGVVGLQATWITIQDGQKALDFVYDTFILNPNPEIISEQDAASHLNLFTLKCPPWPSARWSASRRSPARSTSRPTRGRRRRPAARARAAGAARGPATRGPRRAAGPGVRTSAAGVGDDDPLGAERAQLVARSRGPPRSARSTS